MSKLKSLDQYDKNAGMHIVLGRHVRLPEGAEPGKDLLLMGDCSEALKKRIEKAGGTCLHVGGCPPGEPLPGWKETGRGREALQGLAEGATEGLSRAAGGSSTLLPRSA
jgi:hypothetical protein